MKLYIASFFETKERLLAVREQIQSLEESHVVISTWLDETNNADENMPDKETFWRNLAMKDLAELESADCIILDTLDVNPRGGREVEFGFALSFFHKKLVCIVGPYRNVFHTLAHRQFDNWTDAIEWFRNTQKDKLNKGRIKDPVQEAKANKAGGPTVRLTL